MSGAFLEQVSVLRTAVLKNKNDTNWVSVSLWCRRELPEVNFGSGVCSTLVNK